MNFMLTTEKPGVRLGELAYGTMICVSGHVYIKVNKHKLGNGITLRFTPKHCVLFNPKLGTLREVHGNTVVEILELLDSNVQVYTVSKQEYHKYMKDTCVHHHV